MFARGLVLAAVAALWATPAEAQQRQYYSKYWQKSGGYYYKTYYYKPSPRAEYKHHHVIYYPSQPKYMYYFNPYSKKYWGRYEIAKEGYSKLAPADQSPRLADIKEEAFPAAGAMPDLPESEDLDKPKMEKPPADLPPDESKQLGADEFRQRNPQPAGKELPRQAFSGWCRQGGYYYCCYYTHPCTLR